MNKDVYLDRFNIVVNRNFQTPGPGDYENQNILNKRNFLHL